MLIIKTKKNKFDKLDTRYYYNIINKIFKNLNNFIFTFKVVNMPQFFQYFYPQNLMLLLSFITVLNNIFQRFLRAENELLLFCPNLICL